MANGDAQNPMAPIFQVVQSKREVPMGEQLAQMLQQRAQQSPLFEAQRSQIDETKQAIADIKAKSEASKQHKSLPALAALADIFSGNKNMQYTQLAKSMAPADKTKEINELTKLLASQQAALTDDQINFMKEQMIGVGGGSASSNMGLTPFEKKRDEAFAKDVASWTDAGGYAKVAGNLDALRDIHKQLGEPGDLTNTIKPEFVRKYFPEGLGGDRASVEAQQQVGFVVQQSLKEILGGQFAKEEGVQLINRSYDPALTDEQNQKKLSGMIARLESMAQAKQEAIDYAIQNGTLKGFKGNTKNMTLQEWQAQEAEKLKKDYGVGKYQKKKDAAKKPSFEEWKKQKGYE